MAPHTSWIDFIIGRFGCWKLKIKVKFLIKKEIFHPLIGWFIRAAGGLPVDRSKGHSAINQIVNIISNSEEISIIITPEGTRKPVKDWKKGFYFIALNSKIPIVLGFLDYKTKTGGLGPVLFPSGDYQKDLEIIRNFYKDKQALFPKDFMLPE